MLRNPKYLYGPDKSLTTAKLNLGDFLVRQLKDHASKIALINAATEETLTYNEIVQASMNVAVSLVRIGVKKDDVVGICSESRLENWCAFIGVACTGAVVTPISIAYIKDELRHIMNISKPKYIFCSEKAYKAHAAVYKSLDYVKKIFLFGDERQDDAFLYKDLATVATHSIITENVCFDEFEAVEVEGSDTSCMLFSSGTTGLPKGVMLSHLNLLASISMPEVVDPELTVLTIIPWCHGMGLTTGLNFLINGSKVVFLPKFEIDLYLPAIEKYKVNNLLLVPQVILTLNRTPFHDDVSSVQIILSSAAIIQKEPIEAVKTKFHNLRGVYQGYGMTETTLVTLDSFINGKTCKPDSVGKCLSNIVIKIVDVETREALGRNENGEICIKAPVVMKGYVGKDRSIDFDEEGFFKTGDIGYYDEENFLYIVDRLKELIKYNCYQVPPAEVEAVLLQHRGVCDVGVVGLPRASVGEVPLAFVVLQPGVVLTESGLQKFVAERLSNPKHLRGGVQFIKEIPRNGMGKIQRMRLREMANNI